MDEYKAPKLKIKKIDTSKVKMKEEKAPGGDGKAKFRKNKKPVKMNIIDARAMTQEAVKEGMEMMRIEREKKMKKYFQGK